MNLITPGTDNGDCNKDLLQAKEHFGRAIDVFLAMTNDVERGNFGSEGDNAKTIRALMNATQSLMNEKRKIDESITQQAGIANGYAIDFDGARSEIRRRLAGLRAAASAGEVSE